MEPRRNAPLQGDFDLAVAGGDFADGHAVESRATDDRKPFVCPVRRNKPYHADAHVEDAVHLVRVDAAGLFNEAEDRGGVLDSTRVKADSRALGKDSGNVVVESAAGDMGDAVDGEV